MNVNIREKFQNIRFWKTGDIRAPHKPLLILYAIGRLDERYISYRNVDKDLPNLLDSFGPLRTNQKPQYPFWRLQNDSIWHINSSESIKINNSGDVSAKELINNSITGGFTEECYNELKNNPNARNEIVSFLLNEHFPDSYHKDILECVNINIDSIFSLKKKSRDPKFRENILKAYEYKCCICNLQIRLKNIGTILDAAHIKWHQAGGPCKESNGLSLCVLHHRLFDRGVIGINENLEVVISEYANGSGGFNNMVLQYKNRVINSPISEDYIPNSQFISWHLKEVFKGPIRD